MTPAVERAFRRQADACRRMGSDLYGRLLEVTAADVAAGGPVAGEGTGRDWLSRLIDRPSWLKEP